MSAGGITSKDVRGKRLELPAGFEACLKSFEMVDRAMCFLIKNRVSPTLERVCQFIEDILHSTNQVNDSGLTTRNLVTSFTGPLAGNIVIMHWIPVERAVDEFRLEMDFVTVGGTGKGHSVKRLKLFENALLVTAQVKYERFQRAFRSWIRMSARLLGVLGVLDHASNAPSVKITSWDPLWKHSLSEAPGFFLRPVSPPPEPLDHQSAKATDPYFEPPAPLDADRALTGFHDPPRMMPSPSCSFSSSSTLPSLSFSTTAASATSQKSLLGHNLRFGEAREDDEEVNIQQTLDHLTTLPFYVDQISHIRREEAKSGRFLSFKECIFKHGTRCGTRVLSNELINALRAQGIDQLFAHQGIAIEAALSDLKKHVLLSTGTSSGKSVCFNVPVLESLINGLSGVQPDVAQPIALYLFPTKALAQDQLRSLQSFIKSLGSSQGHIINAAVVDGDTLHSERGKAQIEANIILTNPDMLHITILPNHSQWRRVLQHLRFVVIDEAHVYKGVFGAHVAMVILRLVRICRYYGNRSLQFIYCSATINNPEQHFAQLIPLHALGGSDRLEVITEDSAPRGEKCIVLWNAPFLQSASSEDKLCSPVDVSPVDTKFIYNDVEVHDHKQHVASARAGDTAIDFRQNKRRKISQADDKKPKHFKHGLVIVKKEYCEDTFMISDPHRSQGVAVRSDMPDANTRRSNIVETSRLFTSLVKLGARTLCFSKTRKLCELILRYSLLDLHATAPHLAPLVRSYRGGYTKADRRQIERDLFSRKLLGVTCTCALELGIDVGNLDTTVHVGFPGSISSLRQQAGRAGRGGRRSLAIVTLFDSPLDQLLGRNPESLFEMDPESAIIPLRNTHVLRVQLLCAANEIPLHFEGKSVQSRSSTAIHDHIANLSSVAPNPHENYDLFLFGFPECIEAIEALFHDGSMTGSTFGETREGRVATATICKCHPSLKKPATSANLRMIDPITISIVDISINSEDGGEVIDSIGYSRAFYELFEGAIYLHQARQYLVIKLDLLRERAMVKPVRVSYFTSARNHTDVDVIKKLECGLDAAGIVSTGVVSVVSKVWGWKKHWGTDKVEIMGPISLPPLEMTTRALWIDVPTHIQTYVENHTGISVFGEIPEGSGLSNNLSDLHDISCQSGVSSPTDKECGHFFAAVHALNHVLVAVAPLFVSCEREDIGTEHVQAFQQRPRPARVIIFDTRPGGIGVSEALFQRAPAVLSKAYEILSTCPCHIGCLGCIMSSHCTSQNGTSSKLGAIILCRSLLDIVIGKDSSMSTRCNVTSSAVSTHIFTNSISCDNSNEGHTAGLNAANTSFPCSLPSTSSASSSSSSLSLSWVSSSMLASSASMLSLALTPSGAFRGNQQAVCELGVGCLATVTAESSEAGSQHAGFVNNDRSCNADDDELEFPSTATRLEKSPRVRRRLSQARNMDAARVRGSQMRLSWSNTMVPDFQSEFD